MVARAQQGEDDLKALAAYTVGEAAHYLRLPQATVRAWAAGRSYPTRDGPKRSLPVLAIPSKKPPMLSFLNLAEVHILAAMTRDHDIPLQQVRRAVKYLERAFNTDHPLVERSFAADGRNLFVREALDLYLARIEWGASAFAARLFPFTGRAHANAPRAVMIDPRIAFGKPVLTGTSIPTLTIAERFKAGESEDDLAEDYGRDRSEIEEAIRCELDVAA